MGSGGRGGPYWAWSSLLTGGAPSEVHVSDAPTVGEYRHVDDGEHQTALPRPPSGVPGARGEGDKGRSDEPYGAMGMVQLTGAVTKMRKASYLSSGPMLEISGRPGK